MMFVTSKQALEIQKCHNFLKDSQRTQHNSVLQTPEHAKTTVGQG